MSETTQNEFINIITKCKDIYDKKIKDYGCSWRIMRLPSLTDQIFIKANRIRSIETKGNHRVEDGVRTEFMAIVNYSIMALIQLDLGVADMPDLSPEQASDMYDKFAQQAITLMSDKNHDYDEAWRSMRISSFTDIILTKLLRIKQIENNDGKTLISEGQDANYFDIINYAIFALIKLED